MLSFSFLLVIAVVTATPTAYNRVQSTVRCETVDELIASLYAGDFSVIWILQDLTITEEDWLPYATPIVLQRDVIISGTEVDPLKWPVVDLGYVVSKIKLATNITMSFTRVVIRHWRKGPIFQAPGLDLIATNIELVNLNQDLALPNLRFYDMAFIQHGCLAPSLGTEVTKSMNRPAFAPGNQTFSTSLTQPGCINSSSTARLQQRCWSMVLSFDDMVMYGQNLVNFNAQSAGYVLWLERTLMRCEDVMDEICVKTYGIIGCFYKLYPFAQDLQLRNGDDAGATSTGKSDGREQGAMLAAVLGGLFGGLAFLVFLGGAVAAIIVVLRRRTRQRQKETRGADVAVTDALGPWEQEDASSAARKASPTELNSDRLVGQACKGHLMRCSPGDLGTGGRDPKQLVELGTTGAMNLTPETSGPRCDTAVMSQIPQDTSCVPFMLAGTSCATPVTSRTPLKPDVNLGLKLCSGEVEILPGVIGKGTFGCVVPGRYVGQPVAIKLLNYGLLVANMPPPRQQQQQKQGCGGAVREQRAAVASSFVHISIPKQELLVQCDAAVVKGKPSLSTSILQRLFRGSGAATSPDTNGTSSSPELRPPAERRPSVQLLQAPRQTAAGGGGSGSGIPAMAAEAEACGALATEAAVDAGQGTGPHATLNVAGMDTNSSKPDTELAPSGRRGSGFQDFSTLVESGGVGNSSRVSDSYQFSCWHDWAGRGQGQVEDKGQPAAGGKGSASAAATAAARTAAEAPAAGPHPTDCYHRALLQEIQILARIRHPNIVRLLGACTRPPQICLVMELMETSLARWMYGNVAGKDAPMPLQKVLHIGLQMANALEYLHPTILHRDLKPANVLLMNAASPTPVVKLADFGLSRLQTSVLITENVEVGTVPYMAPETLNAANCAVTHRVDIYALGVILWEMLAGVRPWAGSNLIQIATAVALEHERPPLGILSPERCPPKLRSLIQHCWEQVPERRPAAAEVVKELLLVRLLLRSDTGVDQMLNDAQAKPA